ncbi:MAG: isoaspartyl peptidase/L-asparaginase [Xanthomonadaceae bacterium]|nr:isoaspartyl peptidase/L-asparaginase [Xanthomonadaceae bacterium]MDE1959273.1 isoaspartyl peptidase/L-asparaginase [Xanthomonadaceae bacterium]MDE2177485.1 isoaspartyl peptidase/L-asparaginase [Xanthomonadaceae bacterium]MDE2245503.1 isoaspartyl peptidase/L-asparaginase [Xanthomonadaceae bacterium]
MSHGVMPALVIHGGAGVIRKDMGPEREQAVRAALHAALEHGYAALTAGRSALDAVTAAITVLEDSPHFNAGRGAVFTHDGRVELDAAIMDGATLRAGSVAGVEHVRNPIRLARAVMEHSPHVMLVGAGAEAFARTQDIALAEPSWFHTEERWQQLQETLRHDAMGEHAEADHVRHFGTVGALALDRAGRLAAGTSTGGMTGKRWGRVGDAPVIGAGTWADARCAVSGTGWGEFYLRTAAAARIALRVELLGEPVALAAQAVIDGMIPALGGSGGAIVLGADGSIAMPFNTDGMFRGRIAADGVPNVAIWNDAEEARRAC